MLDQRSKDDLLRLAENLENPDKNLVERYFSTPYLTVVAGKIVHQRLIDQGFYVLLSENKSFQSAQQLFDAINQVSASEMLDTGKGLLNKVKNLAE